MDRTTLHFVFSIMLICLGFSSSQGADGDLVRTLEKVSVADPIWAISWDGSSFWGISNATDILYEFTTDWDVVSTVSFSSPHIIQNMQWAGSKFYWTGSFDAQVRGLPKTGGNYTDEFMLPAGAAGGITLKDGSELYIAQTGTNTIYKYDFPTLGPPQSSTYPLTDLYSLEWDGVAFWAQDGAYNPSFNRMTVNGALLLSTESPTSVPGDMAWNGVTMAMSDPYNLRVLSLDNTGKIISEFPVPIKRPLSPRGIAWDGCTLWVAQKGSRPDNNLIQVTTSGSYIGAITDIQSDVDSNGLAWDGTHLWLSDPNQRILYKYLPDGSLVDEIGIGVSVKRPYDLAFDGTNLHVLRGETPDYDIEKYDLNGALQGSIAWNHVGNVKALSWDGSHLLALDQTNNTVLKLNPSTAAEEGNFAVSDGLDGIEFDGKFLWTSNEFDKSVFQLEFGGNVIPALPADDKFTVNRDTTDNLLNVLTNDQAGLQVFFASQPSSGTTTVTPGKDGVLYTPPAGFRGTEQFYYCVENANGVRGSALVTVETIGANNPPTANPDNFIVAQGAGPHILDVLENDSTLPDTGEKLTINSVFDIVNGTVEIINGGLVVSYKEPDGFTGDASFSYTIDDGFGGESSTTVDIKVIEQNNDPVASDDEFVIIGGRGPQELGVLDNDTALPDVGETLTIINATDPPHGTVTIINAGSGLTYEEDTDYSGDDSFEYTINDGNGGTDSATVDVEISPPTSAWMMN